MRVHELKISNVRGLKSTNLMLCGTNFVVWGPNGSGKSAVVDAIDFLFTGKMSRLIGEGTGDISLRAHGPHVDHKAEEAKVAGLIEITGLAKPIWVQRTISHPNRLKFPAEAEKALQPILGIISKGQLVLSRRHILRFIAAEPGKRAGEVQALLDLRELEEIRRTFTKVENQAKIESNNSNSNLRAAQQTLQNTLGLEQFDENAAVARINELRKILLGAPVTVLSASDLKSNLTPPAASAQIQGVNIQQLRQDFDSLRGALAEAESRIGKPDKELRAMLGEIKADLVTLQALKKLQLLKLGVTLIDEDGSCPLCGKTWPTGALAEHLKTHISEAEALEAKTKAVQKLASAISVQITTINNLLLRSFAAANNLQMKDEAAKINEAAETAANLVQSLGNPLEEYPGTFREIVTSVLYTSTVPLLERLVREAELRLPPLTPELRAWTDLTRIEENVKSYTAAKIKKEEADEHYQLAQLFTSTFEQSRDTVLSSLYRNIELRFTELYRVIHSEDEAQFESELRPDGAGLTLAVDFYKRGKFPPLAVHSEGHQDTMGFCLYLALAEKLNADLVNLIVLDDVVMSVDAGHRRQICTLLKEKFPGKQFVITTHDKTWARQLESAGVVTQQNSVEFSNWSIDSGPFVAEANLWSKIDGDLKKGDVPSAAHRLRRGAEQFFEFACDKLRAMVPYRSSGRYDLSDFTDGAVGAYKKYLRKAKDAAQSWGKDEEIEKLNELETIASQVITRSNLEKWAVNQNVHYDQWGEFCKEDFTPVAEAFRDLFALFRCQEPGCGAALYLETNATKQPTALRCNCGKVNWNLVPKK
jgi:DNA repair exonuclease SbcCD ATPase subunit